MSDFLPLQLPPGIVKGPSPALVPGRWFDGNMVRWVGGVLRPVAGWEAMVLTANPASIIRAVHTWKDNQGVVRTGVLCEANAYIIESGAVTDITPTNGMTAPPANVLSGGYGDGLYGTSTYGAPRVKGNTVKAVGPAWTMDNWGQTLVFMSSYDGRLLQWDPSVVPYVRAAAVAGAPTNNRLFVVTDERHVILFQIGGALQSFGWCSQENINDWNFSSVTNTAGEYDIQPSSDILSAVVVSNGILMFTANKAYLIAYEGTPYIYSFTAFADAVPPVSSASIVEYGGRAMWLTDAGFWTYDGTSASPLQCDLLDDIKQNSDQDYSRLRTFGVNIQTVNEIWFFYPTKGNPECNAYVIWNFADSWWSKGQLKRTCGYKSSYTTYPIFSDGAVIYLHERGQNYADYIQLPWIVSGSLMTKSGLVKGTLVQAITDNSDDPANLLYSFTGRNRSRPDLPSANVVGPKNGRADGYLDIRITARDIQMTLQSAFNGLSNWTMGTMLIRANDRGKR